MKILVLDNYDSFTYNLVHLVRELGYGSEMQVFRNDKISLNEVQAYDKIILSPGPGVPSEAGIMPDLLQKYSPTKSILGVCLGHQAIGEAFGAKLENMSDVLHGIATPTFIKPSSNRLFNNVPDIINTARYHSWTVVAETVPDSMQITAVDENNLVMALAHKTFDVTGVQFHPESILTDYGKVMIENWLQNPLQ
jgi:anthranilate synthase component 2